MTTHSSLSLAESNTYRPDLPDGAVSTDAKTVTNTQSAPVLTEAAYAESKLPYALQHVQRGLLVIPLYGILGGVCTCRQGSRCSSPGKHPRVKSWSQWATIDPKKVRSWWEKSAHQHDNIGIITGTESDLAVIDFDTTEDSTAEQKLHEFKATFQVFTETYVVVTGNGLHLYFRMPAWDLRNSAGKLEAGIDVRADGGYVVGAGSTHVNGKHYTADPVMRDPFEDFPESLRPFLEEQRTANQNQHTQGASLAVDSLVSPVEQGRRNDFLFRHASGLRGTGYEEEAILAALQQVNLERCQPPLSLRELTVIVHSVMRYEPGRPRSESGFAWYKLVIGEYLCNFERMRLTDRQKSWYTTLENVAIMNFGFLPADPAELHRCASADTNRKYFDAEIRDVLREFEDVLIDGKHCLFSARCAAIRAECEGLIAKKRIAGRASAAKRERERESA